ncbi:MAG TPA: protein kinase [Gemmataceae bacterium]|jgi:WD40 repeat protein/tRNA A-37 threonylcarbamoyl transferase component Bud32
MSANHSTVKGPPGRDEDRTLLTHASAEAEHARDLPHLPEYVILSELGRGAMGVVYKARHLALNRIVALKMLHVYRQGDAEHRRRFRTEVETIALLQHPNIVQVYDVGEANGRPFFTMEHADGGSLAERCRGQAQTPSVAAEWVEILARAIHTVHSKSIVHRDLKPSNILRTAEGCLKIADFGLAHQESSHLTMTGQVLGTPCYMAPEQAAGKVREVGPAADVYALGAILYELLAGRPPFRGAAPMEVIREVQESDPLSPRRLEPQIPRDLETICLKCLRKEPGQRYGSARELADDLRRYLGGESIHARPPAWPERAVRWLRRRPALAVVLASVVLTALAVPLALLGHTLRLREALGREQLARDEADGAMQLARIKEAEARAALYAADVKLAHNLFKIGDVFQIPRLLDPHCMPEEADSDPRGFVWGYLQRHGQKAEPPLPAHDGPLHLLAYSPDARCLITAGGKPERPNLRVWNLQTRSCRFRQSLIEDLPSHELTIAAYAPRPGLLAGWSKDGFVTLWDFASGQMRSRFRISADVKHIALSPDGRWLAVSETRRTALWNCATGQLHRLLAIHDGARLAFAPDGQMLLSVHQSAAFRGIQWWDVATGTLREQRAMPDGTNHVLFSPRGTFLLLIDGNGQGAIWSAEERVALHWSHNLGKVRCMAMSEDEQSLATGDTEGRVRIWDIPSGHFRGQYRWQPNAIVQLAFAPDHRTLAVATAEGQVHQFDVTVQHVPDRLQAAAMSGRAIAWSSDGEIVAAAGEGGMVFLFDRRTGASRGILRCPVQEIRCLAFAPDGRTLAVVCQDERVVRLWDVADRRWRAVTATDTSAIIAIAFAANGRRLASLAGDTVRFWDTTTAASQGSLKAEPNTRALTFTSSGGFLLTAGSTLQVWDVRNDESPVRPVSSMAADATAVCLSLNREGRLVTGGDDGRVRLWKVSPDGTLTPDKTPFLRPPSGGTVRCLDLAADSKTLLVSQDGRVELWDLTSRHIRDTLDDPVERAAFSPNGGVLATLGREGALRLWEPETWRVARPAGQSLETVTSLVFSAEGRTLVTAGHGPLRTTRHYRGKVTFDTSAWRRTSEALRFWDAASAQEQSADAPSEDVVVPPHLVACSPNDQLLATGAGDGSIRILDRQRKQWRMHVSVSEQARLYAQSFELARVLWTNSAPDYRRYGEGVLALAFAPDGKRLAAAGNRGSFRVFDCEDGSMCCHWQGNAGGSTWLAFTNDCGVIGSCGNRVCVWDANTGMLRTTLGADTDSPVLCGVLTPGKDILALGSKDGQIRLWDLQSGEVRHLPGGHQNRVTCLAFSPDGKTLASAGWDQTVRLWNLAAGREVAVLEGHKGRIHAVAFSPDGQTLASGGEIDGERGEVLLWR